MFAVVSTWGRRSAWGDQGVFSSSPFFYLVVQVLKLRIVPKVSGVGGELRWVGWEEKMGRVERKLFVSL